MSYLPVRIGRQPYRSMTAEGSIAACFKDVRDSSSDAPVACLVVYYVLNQTRVYLQICHGVLRFNLRLTYPGGG